MVKKPTYEELEQRVKDLDNKLEEAGYKQLWNTYSQSPIPTLVLSQEGKIVDYNDAMAQLTGFVHEEVPDIDSWMHKIYPDEAYRNKVIEVSKKSRHRKKDVKKDEFIITTKAGERHHMEFSVFDISHEGKPMDMQVVQGVDVTEQVQIKEELQKSHIRLEQQVKDRASELLIVNEKLKHEIKAHERAEGALRKERDFAENLIETSQAIILVLDTKGRIVRFNPYMQNLTGYRLEEVRGKDWFSTFLPGNDHDRIRAIYRKAISDIQTRGNINPILSKDGRIIFVEWYDKTIKDAEGHIIGILAIGQDVTERMQNEESLREASSRLQIALDASNIGLWDWNLLSNEVYFSPEWKRQIGYEDNEIQGRYEEWEKRLHPEDKDHVSVLLNDYLNGQRSDYKVKFRLRHKDGTYRWIYAEGKQLFDRNEKAYRMVGCHLDVTEKKHSEEVLLKIRAQLDQAQKMESIGTLAGGIAHDFNNILSPIMIHSEMVMMDLPSGSPLQQNMKQIYKAGERARDLVKQILTFARRQEKERIPLKVSQILKEVIKLLRSTIPTTIDIQYDINSEQDTVLSDPTQLNQIIMNLCTNAAHAMEEKGGTLKIDLTNENLDSESANEFPDLESGRYVKLTVKDTGQGVEPQFMDKIFEPYFTTKAVGKGTGMGLALVHGIVQSYGGVVTVQSEVGKGTSFHVYLPLVEGDMNILETAQDSVQLPTGKERILFVDDEKGAVDAIQPMLENFGYKVTARTSSIEALEAFRNNPQAFDLVITDMTMPNMTGDDLAKELLQIRSDIPIIICTGFSEQIDERRAKEIGMSAFVMKPIVMKDIAHTIRKVMDPGLSER